MKKQLLMLLFAFLSPCFAGIEGSLNNHFYYSGDTAVIILEVDEDYTGIGTVKVCLSNYDFLEGKYSSKCDTLLKTEDIAINNGYSGNLAVSLSGVPESVYRFYLQLAYKLNGTTKTRTDCDDGNFIFIKESGVKEQSQEIEGISLSALTPLKLEPGSTATIYVNLTNNKESEIILLSSFIKNETSYINENLNDDSFKILNITPGSSAIIIMKNKVLENASPGIYDYIIKAESGGKTFQAANSIEILPDELIQINNLSIECPVCEECVQEIVTCKQSNLTQEPEIKGQTSKITAQLNLKRDEYYYIPAMLIGIISLILVYAKIK